MTQRLTVEIDELVLDGVDDGAAAARLVEAEVARALERGAQPALEGRVEQVAAEVGRAVAGSVQA